VTLQKYFSHPSFSYLLFLQSPLTKLKLGQQIGGGLLIANPSDQSLSVHHQYLKWGTKVKKQVIKTHDEESSTQLGKFT
jgi:hypothetical protein